MNIEEDIKTLEEYKKKWNEKYEELVKYAKGYKRYKDENYTNEFKDKLDSLSEELNEIGKTYHKEVERVVDEITKNHKSNPIIRKLVEGVKSDIDDNWSVYKGNREARLRDLADIIEIFDSMQ